MIFGLFVLMLIFLVPIAGHSNFSGGSGTEEDPYRVGSSAQLQAIRHHLDSHFIQVKDIDASDIPSFIPVGAYGNPFTGTYNGDGFSISKLTILLCPVCPGSYVGLFGRVEGAHISNMHLIDVHIEGGSHVGGLIGYHAGKLSNSGVSGLVSGRDHVGGLAGYNAGDIRKSYFRGKIKGEDHVGGLAGFNRGTLINGYVLGSVAGENEVGGLAGFSDNENGYVAYSFSSARVVGRVSVGGVVGFNERGFRDTTISGCYWDMEVSEQHQGIGQGSLEGAEGLSTVQMTGVEAFACMEALDFKEIWLLTEGYPALYWEDVDALDLPVILDRYMVPPDYQLEQNFPNPFNPATRIRFALPEQAHVHLAVYNVLGQRVVTLVNETLSSGWHNVKFDAEGFSSGVWIYRMDTGDYVGTRSMLLVR